MQKIQQHLAQHMMFLKKMQPEAFKQTVQAIQQLEAGGAPGGAPPGNISQMSTPTGEQQLATGSIP